MANIMKDFRPQTTSLRKESKLPNIDEIEWGVDPSPQNNKAPGYYSKTGNA